MQPFNARVILIGLVQCMLVEKDPLMLVVMFLFHKGIVRDNLRMVIEQCDSISTDMIGRILQNCIQQCNHNNDGTIEQD